MLISISLWGLRPGSTAATFVNPGPKETNKTNKQPGERKAVSPAVQITLNSSSSLPAPKDTPSSEPIMGSVTQTWHLYQNRSGFLVKDRPKFQCSGPKSSPVCLPACRSRSLANLSSRSVCYDFPGDPDRINGISSNSALISVGGNNNNEDFIVELLGKLSKKGCKEIAWCWQTEVSA